MSPLLTCTCFARACAAPTSLTPSQMHPEALSILPRLPAAKLAAAMKEQAETKAQLNTETKLSKVSAEAKDVKQQQQQNQQQAQQQQHQTQQQAKSLTKLTSVPCRGGSRPRRTQPNWPAPAEAKLCLGTGLPVHGSPPPHTAQTAAGTAVSADHSQVPTRRVA